MHFSLKGALAITTYVALTAAAFGTQSSVLADLVWAIAILSAAFAAVVTFFGSTSQRPRAMGFIVVWAINVACIYFAPDRVPSSRLLEFGGYRVARSGKMLTWIKEPTPSGGVRRNFEVARKSEPVASTANAAGTMAAGFVGYLLGAVACRCREREQSASV